MPTLRVPLLLAPLVAAGCSRTVVVTEPPPRAAVQPQRGPDVTLGIPPGHMPRRGECRVWIPGVAPGRQPRPKSRPCAGIGAAAPAGSWILYRPAADRKLVHVRVVDERRAGVVLRVRVFELDSGRFLREEHP